MTILRAFAITIASGLAFGIAGALIGFGVGTWLPDFYRTVFRIPREMAVDPAQIGLALGLVNGLLFGVGVGLIIVVVVTWYNARTFGRG